MGIILDVYWGCRICVVINGSSPWVQIFRGFLGFVGIFVLPRVFSTDRHSPAIPLMLAWISGNCPTETKRSLGLSVAVSLGNTIPIALPWAFSLGAGPRFFVGYAICTGLLVFACLLALGIHWYFRWENAKADREYGTVTGTEKIEDDEDVRFRYFD